MNKISKISLIAGIHTSFLLIVLSLFSCGKHGRHPNIIFVFADEWRAQATGYCGDPNVQTPNLDALAAEGIAFTTAVSGTPVCSPYRASLLTGQYPLTHGVFYNDRRLIPKAPTMAEILKANGYATAYIGKWHLNGHDLGQTRAEGRRSPVRAERRFGFDFWKVCECTHDYNHSIYFDEQDSLHIWPGYDAIAQTRTAQAYIRSDKQNKPFILLLSWGPPHDPYQTAPEKYRQQFNDPARIRLRTNVPDSLADLARTDLDGYYAHIAALDDCLGDLLEAVKTAGIEDNTIFIFTSDHGDMMYSQGMTKKQKPWDESILVPFVLKYPAQTAIAGKVTPLPISTVDILPTLLGFCDISIPATLEGEDLSGYIKGETTLTDRAVLISCPLPFHQWNYRAGGREYRGIRTSRYTYVRDLKGPWLFYDNQTDPFQLDNLVNMNAYSRLQSQLDSLLSVKLRITDDHFLTGQAYMDKWNYKWDEHDAPGPR